MAFHSKKIIPNYSPKNIKIIKRSTLNQRTNLSIVSGMIFTAVKLYVVSRLEDVRIQESHH